MPRQISKHVVIYHQQPVPAWPLKSQSYSLRNSQILISRRGWPFRQKPCLPCQVLMEVMPSEYILGATQGFGQLSVLSVNKGTRNLFSPMDGENLLFIMNLELVIESPFTKCKIKAVLLIPTLGLKWRSNQLLPATSTGMVEVQLKLKLKLLKSTCLVSKREVVQWPPMVVALAVNMPLEKHVATLLVLIIIKALAWT
ncbi:hypothetical protein Gotur_026640 [Gossypium turneri]